MPAIPYDTVLDRVRERYIHEPEVIRRLRDETASHPNAGMLLDAEGGAFLATLTRTIAPKKTLDIGVFTGFSSLTVARNAPGARIIALDIDAETTQIARRYWEEAGVADRIDLRIGPALDALVALIAAGEAGTFDFAFIDADKPGYPKYVDCATELLRPGGTMLLDNMLWSVLGNDSEHAGILDKLARNMAADPRFSVSMLPLGSGMTLAVKNG